MKQPTVSINGTVDEILNQCSNLEPVEDFEDLRLTRDEAINELMSVEKISRAEAEREVTECQMEEFDKHIAGLLEKGIVEVVKYDDNGEPMYGLTPLGKSIAEEYEKSLKKGSTN